MASSPLRVPAAGQSRLLDMQKKFQQKHLANVAAVKGAALGPATTTDVAADKPSIPPVRKFGGGGVAGLQQNYQQHQPPQQQYQQQHYPQQQQQQQHQQPQQQPQHQKPQRQEHQRRPVDSGTADGGDPVILVDVKGKVRQLFAERHSQQPKKQRQRRRSMTGRDRSQPLRPMSNSDPLCKTVCFTSPSMAGGADMVGGNGTNDDVRGELLALFGRLPNLGGSLWSESFRNGGRQMMKTAKSAPELKLLLDDGDGGKVMAAGYDPGPRAGVPGKGGGGPGPPVAAGPNGKQRTVKAAAAVTAAAAAAAAVTAAAAAVAAEGDDDDDDDGEYQEQQQQQQLPAGRINSKTATIVKKPLATINNNAVKKPAANDGPMYNNTNNRLLLPPVVQPTVINALAAGVSAADAAASVAAAAAAGPQKQLVKPVKLPPAGPTPQKPAAPSNRRPVVPLPIKAQAAVSPRHPAAVAQRAKPVAKSPAKPAAAAAKPAAKVAAKPAAAVASSSRPISTKQQLSADRPQPASGMARCPLCARDFATDRLPKHEEVCRRTRDRDRKRKVFDVSKKRLEAVAAEAGVDVASFKKKSQKEDQRVAEKLQRKKDAWRRKHEALVRNVRNARLVQQHLAAGGNIRDLPPELQNAPDGQDDEVDSDLVKCPHCGRTFNEASAERHVPLCADRQRNAAVRLQNKKR